MQCGAACLAMLCRFFGKNIPLEYLSNLCDVSVEGASLKGIAYAANTIGITVKLMSFTLYITLESKAFCNLI